MFCSKTSNHVVNTSVKIVLSSHMLHFIVIKHTHIHYIQQLLVISHTLENKYILRGQGVNLQIKY